MAQDQAAPPVVSLRERVKSPPAETMVESYYAPAVAAGIRFQFEPEMKIHLAHALMLAERKIVDRSDVAQIVATLLALRQTGVSARPSITARRTFIPTSSAFSSSISALPQADASIPAAAATICIRPPGAWPCEPVSSTS